jgi:hypothetical protein
VSDLNITGNHSMVSAEFKEGQMFDENPSIINVPLGDLPRERSES